MRENIVYVPVAPPVDRKELFMRYQLKMKEMKAVNQKTSSSKTSTSPRHMNVCCVYDI